MTTTTSPLRWGLRWLTAGAGLAAAGYVIYVATAWARYGHVPRPAGNEADPLLDRFMPEYEVVERHHVRIAAPPAITLAAAREMDLRESRVARAIFKGRELILGATPEDHVRPRGLLALVQSLGWVVLAELPDREVVVGAVTRPWEPNPTFRGVPPEAFAAFAEPGYVKIAWTLRVDPDGPAAAIFRSETRATATDPSARARFRRYWSCLSPGIILIRRLMLGPLKADAERRARTGEVESARVSARGSGSGTASCGPSAGS
jgi:hypothetical protein